MQSGNPNIREEVQDSRGLLKKIQLHIPLFRGYRKLEDIRVADELLRKEISNVLQQVMEFLQNERSSMIEKSKFDRLTSVGAVLARVQEFQGEILHAQQGSSGISPAIKLDQSKLNSLYEYDLKFLDICAKLRDLSTFPEGGDVDAELEKLSTSVMSAKTAWESRLQAVEDILLSTRGAK